MAGIQINWNLPRSKNLQRPKNRFTSSYALNTEWNLVCWWSQYDPYTPDYLEIRRISSTNEIQVSGHIKLFRGTTCLSQQKVDHMIKPGVLSIEITLGNYNSSYYSGSYSITGSLKIVEVQKDHLKGIQMESLLNLSTNLECLLDSKTNYFSDVILKCDTVSLSAHKCILSARSPVFAAMFANQMKENLDNKVVIKYISSNNLKTILTYLYTGKTGDLSLQSAGELLFAADMYQLKDLKRVCSEYLKGCLSFQNMLNTLVLGHLHDQGLKTFTLNFICECSEKFEILEETPEWTTLRKKRPDLAMDVLTSLVKSKDKKLEDEMYS